MACSVVELRTRPTRYASKLWKVESTDTNGVVDCSFCESEPDLYVTIAGAAMKPF